MNILCFVIFCFSSNYTSALAFFVFVTKLTSVTAFLFSSAKTYLSDIFLCFRHKTYLSDSFFSFSSAKLASVKAFCCFLSAKLKSRRQVFYFPSKKHTSAPIFCRKCFRLWWANYKTGTNYWAQSPLFSCDKLKIKKRKKQHQKSDNLFLSKSIKCNSF